MKGVWQRTKRRKYFNFHNYEASIIQLANTSFSPSLLEVCLAKLVEAIAWLFLNSVMYNHGELLSNMFCKWKDSLVDINNLTFC